MTPLARRPVAQRLAVGAAIWTAALVVAACVPSATSAPRAGTAPGQPAGAQAQFQQPAQSQVRAVSPASLSTDVTIVGNEFAFLPATVQVPAGTKATITFENKGVIQHDLVVQGTGFMLDANAGQTARGEFTFDTPGTYALICSIPGHKEAGMKGTFTVVGATPAGAPAQPTAMALSQPVAPQPTPAAKPLPAGLTPLPQPQVAPPLNRVQPATVQVDLETREVTAQLADGVAYTYWTFNGSVPGPMLRVREGDTVELTLKNAASSKVTHSIDLHAVNGPGGGAAATQIPPGGEASFRFTALNPGVYVYHCATPMIPMHVASGMYGLIVVEPPAGLPKVDREFYVMQGDFYLQGQPGEQGLRDFAMDKMLAETPDYVVFNGRVGALTQENALKAKVGETVRFFFGVGGPNLVSSFHLIGEVFDRVWREGATSEPARNVQTTLVPAGGATVVEFKADVPGTYLLVDHSLARTQKGAAGQLIVEGAENPQVFQPLQTGSGGSGGH